MLQPQRPAYLNPSVDSSKEPFAWGFPNLDQLRVYLAEELSWSVTKVDNELLPIVQRIARRGHGVLAGTNRQGTLDGFFDASGGQLQVFAPKVRNSYPSKRLQAVVQKFRESVAKEEGGVPTKMMFADDSEEDVQEVGVVANQSNEYSSDSGSEKEAVAPRKGKSKKSAPAKSTRGRGRGRGKGAGTSTGRGRAGGRTGQSTKRAREALETQPEGSATPNEEEAEEAAPAAKKPRPAPKRRTAKRKVSPVDESGEESERSLSNEQREDSEKDVAGKKPRPKAKPRMNKQAVAAEEEDGEWGE